MLVHSIRRWLSIESKLGQRYVFTRGGGGGAVLALCTTPTQGTGAPDINLRYVIGRDDHLDQSDA